MSKTSQRVPRPSYKANASAAPPIPPRPVDSAGVPYPDRLNDERAIAAYIATLSPRYVDEQFVEEAFWGGCAVLRLLPVTDVREGHADGNIRSVEKERRYRRLPAETLPPILVEDGETQDGNHRLRLQRDRGQTHVWVYDVHYPDDA